MALLPPWELTHLAVRWSCVEMVCGREVPPILPFNGTSYPASPSLKWVPWASVPHPTGPDYSRPSVIWSAKTSKCPSQVPSLFAIVPWYLVCPRSFVCSIMDSSAARELATDARAFDLPVTLRFWVSWHKETVGSPEFPSYPFGCMLRSRTPVVPSVHRPNAPCADAFRHDYTVGFHSRKPQEFIPMTTTPISGLNHTAYILDPPGFVLPLLGWHAGFTTDLPATL